MSTTVCWTKEKTIDLCTKAIKAFEDARSVKKSEAVEHYIAVYSKPNFWNLWHPPTHIEEEAKKYVDRQFSHGYYWLNRISDVLYVAEQSECEFINVGIDTAKKILEYQSMTEYKKEL